MTTISGTSADDTLTGTREDDFFDLRDGGADRGVGDYGADVFYFGAAFDSADSADGGDGLDTIVLQGRYDGAWLTGANMSSVDVLLLLGRSDSRYGGSGTIANHYDVTLRNSGLALYSLLVDGRTLGSDETVSFDGSTEVGNVSLDLFGGGGDDVLTAGHGFDTLDGGAGADRMTGGDGGDKYFVDNVGDVVIEGPIKDALDHVRTTLAAYTLPDNVELLTGLLSTGQILTGNADMNNIQGGEGDDVLDGGGADVTDPMRDRDWLHGNGGDDRFLVSAAPGEVYIYGGAGTDTVVIDWSAADTGVRFAFSSVTPGSGAFRDYTGRWVEYHEVERVDVTTGTGRDYIVLGPGDNRVSTGAGDDEVYLAAGNNVADGGEGVDALGVDLSAATAAITWDIRTGLYSGVVGDYRNFEYLGALSTGSGDDIIVTSIGYYHEYIKTGGGDDVVTVAGGFDTVEAATGFDTLIVDYSRESWDIATGSLARSADGWSGTFGHAHILEVSFSGIERFIVTGGGGGDAITGGDGNDVLSGGPGADRLDGGAGDDALDGGTGGDTMIGGAGDDVYMVDSAGDVVTELAGEGRDRVVSALSTYVLPDNVEDLTGTYPGGMTLTGNALANVIEGAEGADRIWLTGGGADTARGGGGDDFFYFGAAFGDDLVDGGAGSDYAFLQGNYAALTLSPAALASVEHLTFLGAHDSRFGGQSDIPYRYDVTTGNAVLASGIFIDGRGLSPDESLRFDGSGAVVDRIGLYLFGGQGADTLIGSARNDQILGGEGDDRLEGKAGDDTLDGGAGNDTLIDTAGSGTLWGGVGDDVLIVSRTTGVGPDYITVEGEDGNDDATVDLAAFSVVNVNMGAGDDIVRLDGLLTGVWSTLGAGQDSILVGGRVLGSGGAFGVTDFAVGDGGDRIDWTALAAGLIGYQAGTSLFANGYARLVQNGADTRIEIDQDGAGRLYGFEGVATLEKVDSARLTAFNLGIVPQSTATSANDWVQGGAGADVIDLSAGGDDLAEGNGGNDYFYFGGAFTAADRVNGGAGTDSVGLLGNYNLTLGANSLSGVENFSLLSGTAAGGTEHVSYAITTVDANVPAGGRLTVYAGGLLADESLFFNGYAETDGALSVYGGAGNDTFAGGPANDAFVGGAGDDTMYGLGGMDWLEGGLGADTMRGGPGNDLFVYQSAAESTAAKTDHILDFEYVSDHIDLTRIDANTGVGGDQAFSFIGDSAFSHTAGELRAYQSGASWFVEGDVNGDGNADLVIQVDSVGGHPLIASDFLL
jgi:Ca2+-binding RTX toxin-like protein